MSDITVPTLLGQGQADTLFNLQESAATYTALRKQGTPVALDWQSWGHSHSTPVPGELDERHPADSYQGRQALDWLNYYVRGIGTAPAQDFRYFRDWKYTGASSIGDAYAVAPSYPPARTMQTWYLSGGQAVPGVSGAVIGDPATLQEGGGTLVSAPGAVTPGTSLYGSPSPIGPNYSETSALDQSGPPTDPPGAAISFASGTLESPVDVVGSPKVTVRLNVPTAATQTLGTAGQLVVYAKLYDVGPNGAVELPHRLISPARVADVNSPITIELPAIAHEFAAGHRLALVLAGGDFAYRGSDVRHAVTLTTDPAQPQTLVLPVVAG
jgi:ABC-2 type transport system ATP-binding protein